jgi:hypothetical protein
MLAAVAPLVVVAAAIAVVSRAALQRKSTRQLHFWTLTFM